MRYIHPVYILKSLIKHYMYALIRDFVHRELKIILNSIVLLVFKMNLVTSYQLIILNKFLKK